MVKIFMIQSRKPSDSNIVDFGLRIVETPQRRRIRGASKLAIQRRTIVAVIGAPGSMKTVSARAVCGENPWPVPPVEVLRRARKYFRSNKSLIFEILAEVGLLTIPTYDDERWIHERLREVDYARGDQGLGLFRDWNPRRRIDYVWVGREQVGEWVKEYAKENQRGPLDEKRVSLLLGIVPDDIRWFGVYLRGQILTTPGVLLGQLCMEIGSLHTPWAMADRLASVHNTLRELPIFIIMDECDGLRVGVLEFLRELNELCGTPIVLLGTTAFRTRLQHNIALRPLATRIALVESLRAPSLKDLQEALPNLPGNVISRAWARAGGNVRVFDFILRDLRRALRGNQQRLSLRLVDRVADLLPASKILPDLEPQEQRSVAQNALAPALTGGAQLDRRRGATVARQSG